MPTNLFTGESIAEKKKGRNLLPELTGLYKDSEGSAILPETSRKEPFIKDMYNAIQSGLNQTWATAARIPAGVYDLAAIPQNFLVKSLGRSDLQVKSPEWLMDNPVAEAYDYNANAFRKEITPTKSFEEAFATKDFNGIGRHLAIQVAENAPQQIGIILSYMAGYPGAGLAGMGMLETTSSLKEGRKNKKDPAMNAYNSLAKGVIEAGFESIGTMGIMNKWSTTLRKSFGTKNTKQIIGDVFKTIFHSMAGEGNEEFWTSLAQDFSDFTTGINKDAMKGSLTRAFEAGSVGAVSGGLMTGPGAIKLGHTSASLNKMRSDVEQVRKTVEEEAKPIEVEEAVKDIISGKKTLYHATAFGKEISKEGFKLPVGVGTDWEGIFTASKGVAEGLLTTMTDPGRFGDKLVEVEFTPKKPYIFDIYKGNAISKPAISMQQTPKAIQKQLQKLGYDSMIAIDSKTMEIEEAIAFNPKDVSITKPTPAKPASLIEEAKKYKTAEEFEKAMSKPYSEIKGDISRGLKGAIQLAQPGEGADITTYDKLSQEEWFGKGTEWQMPIPKKDIITIYRATEGTGINIGDYVTPSESYAKGHLEDILRGEGKVLSIKVNKKDLVPVNPLEFWYIPKELSKYKSLEDLWQQAHKPPAKPEVKEKVSESSLYVIKKAVEKTEKALGLMGPKEWSNKIKLSSKEDYLFKKNLPKGTVFSAEGTVIDPDSRKVYQFEYKNSLYAIKYTLPHYKGQGGTIEVYKYKKAVPAVLVKPASLIEEAKKYKTVGEFVGKQQFPDIKISKGVEKGKDVSYRGQPIGTEIKENTQRTATYGKGLYTTKDISQAKEYGEVHTVKGGIPKNPVFFRQHGEFGYWLLTKSGEKNIRIFDKKYPDLAKYVKSLGYDGVQIGSGKDAEYVLYPTTSKAELESIYQQAHKPEVKEVELFEIPEEDIVKERPVVKIEPQSTIEGFVDARLEAEAQAMGERLEDLDARKMELNDLVEVARRVRENKINISKTGIAEELQDLPVQFKTKEGGISADEALGAFNDPAGPLGDLGLTFADEGQMVDFLNDLIGRIQSVKAEIAELKPKKITKTDISLFKEKLKNIQRGARVGKVATKKEIKENQAAAIKLIDNSNLEAKDKAKFIKTIKNIDSHEKLIADIPDLLLRIERLEQAEAKNKIEKSIKKEFKATKPVKKGARVVGKYDYQSNKIIKNLNDYNKLTKEQAQQELNLYPEEANTYTDLINKRMLSLKANGKTSSVQMYESVLEDLRFLKKAGEQAKDDADFEKRVERQERVEEALTAINSVKGDKKTIKTMISKTIQKGISNIGSLFNYVAGKSFADKHNPEIYELNRVTAVYEKTKKMADKVLELYDEKNYLKTLDNMGRKDYTITDFDGLDYDITKNQIIDIYNSIKNDKKREDYYNAFGEEQVTNLINNLEDADLALADYLMEEVQGYKEILNQHKVETTGLDNGVVENYWPATSEHQLDIFDDIRLQGETPSAEKERAKGRVIPIPYDAILKFQRHVAQAEHVKHVSREYERLKRVFNNRTIKHAIEKKFGEDIFKVLNDQLDNLSLNAQVNKIDYMGNLFGMVVNNWVTAKIALNPSTYIRQLMSTGNYVEEMTAKEWVTGFVKGLSTPKETFDFMWENDPSLEARFNRGYSEALKNAIDGSEKLNRHWGSWTKFLSSFARSGDITAIIYGGYPLVQSELAKHGDMKKAIEVFQKATIRAQQSGLSSSLSQAQNLKNPFARPFLAFKNTVTQYLRKMVDATIAYQNSNITLQEYSKIMTIYGIIAPTLYATSGFALKEGLKGIGRLFRDEDDDEDIEEKMQRLALEAFTQIAISPVNAIPFFDDIWRYAVRKATGQKTWKLFNTPVFDELETAKRLVSKKEITAKDYLEISGAILEPTTAAPIKTPLRLFRYITGDKKKKGKKANF